MVSILVSLGWWWDRRLGNDFDFDRSDDSTDEGTYFYVSGLDRAKNSGLVDPG
jgi:hypothetical protein